MITADNIASHEFIGLDTEIVGSSNPQMVGLKGRIVYETRSMFTINTARGTRMVQKDSSRWRFSLGDGDAVVDGSRIAKRPFDRIGGKA